MNRKIVLTRSSKSQERTYAKIELNSMPIVDSKSDENQKHNKISENDEKQEEQISQK